MTKNRLQKAQIRELARMNNLSYTEAKQQFDILQAVQEKPLKHLPAGIYTRYRLYRKRAIQNVSTIVNTLCKD